MTLPRHYYSGLSKKNTTEQLNEIKKSKKLYKTGKYHIRKKLSSFKSKPSKHVVKFEKNNRFKSCRKIYRNTQKIS